MTDDLRAELQSTLGSAYHLERELGGGGMSRVFVARDESLGREVVIKVLSPELAASLSAERFTREIRQMGYQVAQTNIDAATKAIDEAYGLDPSSAGIVAGRIFLPLLAGRVDEASGRSHSVPAGMMELLNYGDALPAMLLDLTGQGQTAESAYVDAEQLMGHRSPSLGVFYVKTGRLDAARRMLADIERTWPAKYIPPELVARLPAALGDTATMYKWLERGLAARSAWVGYLNIIQLEFSPHRAEPHFQSILARAGLKDAGTSVRR